MILKDDVDYPDYFQISDDGQVYSKRTSKILKTGISKTGYVILSSRIGGRTGKAICLRIHRMVAKSFIPNPDNKPEVNHKDGNKTNNCVSNLEWVTAKENTKHSYDNGLRRIKNGSQSPNSKLSETDVNFIRENFKSYDSEYGLRAMGRLFNVNKDTIRLIINNKTWIK